MNERYSQGYRQALGLAADEARAAGRQIGTGELLLGICRAGEPAGTGALAALGVTEEALRMRLAGSRDPRLPRKARPGSFTPSARDAVGKTLGEALRLGDRYIGSGHLLLGLVRERRGAAAQLLAGYGAELERLRGIVAGLRHG